jgi:hypothetical protein
MPYADGVMLEAMPGEFASNRPPEAPDTPCGCTNCFRLFTYADIADFWDEGETPVCPCCGLGTVVVSTPDMIVDERRLFAMRKTY